LLASLPRSKLSLKVCAGGAHDQLCQNVPVERNTRIHEERLYFANAVAHAQTEIAASPVRPRVDYPGNVGENECSTSLDPDSSGVSVFVFTCGPVAQLGARFHGMEEVVGSIPTRSTNISTT
jgi:hypothetical protein